MLYAVQHQGIRDPECGQIHQTIVLEPKKSHLKDNGAYIFRQMLPPVPKTVNIQSVFPPSYNRY